MAMTWPLKTVGEVDVRWRREGWNTEIGRKVEGWRRMGGQKIKCSSSLINIAFSTLVYLSIYVCLLTHSVTLSEIICTCSR